MDMTLVWLRLPAESTQADTDRDAGGFQTQTGLRIVPEADGKCWKYADLRPDGLPSDFKGGFNAQPWPQHQQELFR